LLVGKTFMFQDNDSLQDAVPRSSSGAKGWLIGMLTGQLAGFTAAAFYAPHGPIVPTFVISTLIGGLLGGLMGMMIAAYRVRKASSVEDTNERIFRALDLTEFRMDTIIEDEFNNVAANSNGDSRRMKSKPELKVAAPTIAPRMGGM
jgi:hypothetical protein